MPTEKPNTTRPGHDMADAAQDALPMEADEKALAELRPWPVQRWQDGSWRTFDERLSSEVAVRVSWPGGTKDLWAWPDDLAPLCLGHVLLECAGAAPLTGDIPLVQRLTPPDGGGTPHFAVNPLPSASPPEDCEPGRLSPPELLRHMEYFLELPGRHPGLWDDTGCFHRAGMLDIQTASILRLAEDIGRHNCLDRLAGWARLAGVPPESCVLFLSARITASLYAKARRAGFLFMVSRSAVTSEPVDRARAEGVTLVGFCRHREGRFTVFADQKGRVKA